MCSFFQNPLHWKAQYHQQVIIIKWINILPQLHEVFNVFHVFIFSEATTLVPTSGNNAANDARPIIHLCNVLYEKVFYNWNLVLSLHKQLQSHGQVITDLWVNAMFMSLIMRFLVKTAHIFICNFYAHSLGSTADILSISVSFRKHWTFSCWRWKLRNRCLIHSIYILWPHIQQLICENYRTTVMQMLRWAIFF